MEVVISAFWRLLPKKIFVHQAEASAPDCKISNERISYLRMKEFANGTNKLDLLV